jgi:hypothetical protein
MSREAPESLRFPEVRRVQLVMAYIGKVIYKLRRSVTRKGILMEPGNYRMLTVCRRDPEAPLILLSVGVGEE